MTRSRLVSKSKQPDVIVAHVASSYGASFAEDGTVVIYDQTIKDNAVRWKIRGSAKWDALHGMYAITGHLPVGVTEKLVEGLRKVR